MRATNLGLRNQKEETPLSSYYPQITAYGSPLNKFEARNQSESNVGSWGRDQRFCQGSIYKELVDRTTQNVGPGTYKDEEALQLLKKKPCMSTFHQPDVAPNESVFDIQGHQRIIKKSYMPRDHQEQFDTVIDKFQRRLGSKKINDTMVFKKTV